MDLGRLTTAALLAAALVGLVLSMLGEAPRGLHVSGDMAGALPRGDAASPEAARVEVVALWGWTKLPSLPGAAALCGPACEAVPGPRVVRVIDLAPRGVRKIVLIRLGEGAGVTEPGPGAARCARAIVRAEAARLLGAAPPCAGEAVTRWRLPLGLGFVTASGTLPWLPSRGFGAAGSAPARGPALAGLTPGCCP